MAKIPGTFVILPDLVWNPNDPPVKNGCNSMVEIHAPECDGKCEKTPLTELETSMVNEARAWGRLGMDTSKCRIDVFNLQIMVNALMELLDVDKNQLYEIYIQKKLEEMQRIRIANEDGVRQQKIAITNQIILGPNGQALN